MWYNLELQQMADKNGFTQSKRNIHVEWTSPHTTYSYDQPDRPRICLCQALRSRRRTTKEEKIILLSTRGKMKIQDFLLGRRV